jgi:hypothetical protein
MIRFGVRLTLRGGREAMVRLIITAAAVALGVGLLLTTLAGINAVNVQNGRYAWLETSFASASPSHTSTAAVAGHDPVWWLITADYFDGQTIGRVDVAATGPNSPLPPGITALPGPGQYDASPAMTALLRSIPTADLGQRYPGRQVATIGRSALPAPNSLIIIIGHTPAQLARVPGAGRITSISTTTPSSCNNCAIDMGITSSGVDLILAVVFAGLLFPVLIFIGAAARLSATRREQRFAAMRLVGATPRQISVIAAIESALAALGGTVVGFGLFFAVRPLLAPIPFTGAPFYPGDLSLRLADVAAVAIGVPLAAVIAARLALRRIQISPLGASRHTTPLPPRGYRLIPLALGVAELGYFVLVGNPHSSAGQVRAYVPGLVLIMAGLVVAGPWLTMLGARFMARRADRPDVLIAGRRLADNPHAAFRAISGLVLALFVGTTTVAIISTFVAERGGSPRGTATADNLVEQFGGHVRTSGSATASIPPNLAATLAAVSGVSGVATIHARPGPNPTPNDSPTGVIACAQLATVPSLGRCSRGAAAASIAADVNPRESRALVTWPAATISPEALIRLPVETVIVSTNGSTTAIERARTILEVDYPAFDPPATFAEFDAQSTRLIAEYEQLGNVVVLVSLVIAGCSLAASVAGGLSDRKRPFSLLRLSGVPLGLLRRVVALESAVPLLSAAVVAIAMGFIAAQLFLTSQLGYTLRAPSLEYCLIVLAGLVASMMIIALTLPLLDRISGPEVARND